MFCYNNLAYVHLHQLFIIYYYIIVIVQFWYFITSVGLLYGHHYKIEYYIYIGALGLVKKKRSGGYIKSNF